ncbi:MAG TPA: F0F1 ATP synthase subunit A [Candidatus Paceibacterota bacterium]|nr:F0F1 ATP synthase subunit A [Candidatus Paceibacterota bacterium]
MEGLHISLRPEQLGTLFGFPITNTLLTTWLVVIVLLVFAFVMRGKIALIPGKVQTFLELAFLWVLDFMAETLESEQLARKFFPLIMTLFVFILFANYSELIPGIGSLTFGTGAEKMELFHPVSTDLNFTLALTLVSVIITEIVGVTVMGVLKYGSKFVNLSSVLGFLIGIIELISEIARLISFSFRLFGNMFAGDVLILVATFFIPYFLPVPIFLFEFFIGLIQAAIFALLTLLFIKLAMTDPHEHESEPKNAKANA